MESNQTRCYRWVDDILKMIKYGKIKSANQRYICRACGKTRVENYAYLAYKGDVYQNIIQLTKEGLGSLKVSNLKSPDLDFAGFLR